MAGGLCGLWCLECYLTRDFSFPNVANEPFSIDLTHDAE
jgi:hypothetical protein